MQQNSIDVVTYESYEYGHSGHKRGRPEKATYRAAQKIFGASFPENIANLSDLKCFQQFYFCDKTCFVSFLHIFVFRKRCIRQKNVYSVPFFCWLRVSLFAVSGWLISGKTWRAFLPSLHRRLQKYSARLYNIWQRSKPGCECSIFRVATLLSGRKDLRWW